jgi:hypothetical protein
MLARLRPIAAPTLWFKSADGANYLANTSLKNLGTGQSYPRAKRPIAR